MTGQDHKNRRNALLAYLCSTLTPAEEQQIRRIVKERRELTKLDDWKEASEVVRADRVERSLVCHGGSIRTL